jgi:hypothetical protein
VGETVWAVDPETAERSARAVLGTSVRLSGELVRVDTAGGTVGVTPAHPFWVPGQGWVPAAQLAAGMAVGTADGHAVNVLSRGIQEHLGPVYNLEVEGLHTYAVGHDGLLVHNGLRCLPGIPGGLRDAEEAFRQTKVGFFKTSKHSRVLRENLKSATGAGCDGQVHHIVLSGLRWARAASLARGLLARYKIDFNDAVNGVCISKLLHHTQGLHSRRGIMKVYRALLEAEKGVPGDLQSWAARQERVARKLREGSSPRRVGDFRGVKWV